MILTQCQSSLQSDGGAKELSSSALFSPAVYVCVSGIDVYHTSQCNVRSASPFNRVYHFRVYISTNKKQSHVLPEQKHISPSKDVTKVKVPIVAVYHIFSSTSDVPWWRASSTFSCFSIICNKREYYKYIVLLLFVVVMREPIYKILKFKCADPDWWEIYGMSVITL